MRNLDVSACVSWRCKGDLKWVRRDFKSGRKTGTEKFNILTWEHKGEWFKRKKKTKKGGSGEMGEGGGEGVNEDEV